jgi:threonine dehydrogenase-like Zn-dependent dehydrogenase
MLAMNYRGPYRIRADQKPEPRIEHPNDAIVRVTRSCICGSDLHLYHGLVPDTRIGTTFGHEFTGVVEQVGPSVQNLAVGDRVLVPFNVFCGSCYFCSRELYGNCHETNPEATAVGGIYGYSHTAGGYDGGQAEYVRVPLADVGPTAIPADMDVDDAVLLTDAFPTGYQAAEMGEIREGDTVVVFGAGPVGLFAAKSAWLLGAGRVIVVDHVEYRLEFARRFAQCETIDFKSVRDMAEHIKKLTDGLGADVCIDAVGCEAAGSALHTLSGVKLKLQGGAATVLHWCINSGPQGRRGLHRRCLRPDLQRHSDRKRGEQGPDAAHEPGERQATPAAPHRARAGWARAPERGDHAPRAAARGGGRLSHFLEQARRLHQDRAGAAASAYALSPQPRSRRTTMSIQQKDPGNGAARRDESRARHAHVHGWGADLDPANRPAVPAGADAAASRQKCHGIDPRRSSPRWRSCIRPSVTG